MKAIRIARLRKQAEKLEAAVWPGEYAQPVMTGHVLALLNAVEDGAIAEWELSYLLKAVIDNVEVHHNPISHELNRRVADILAERRVRP